ncbi:YihY/virulence factor BrkB family protein [Nocardioides sp. Leaf374]|uniref:YihY/virulence factor BrkB family protein n=1 Tax=Nocardioides sp. Leaf374 TaxID=2876560 RepID=UPI001E4893AC|nr:YihY/virulence factor BrkB family protein [Nocardioides sp. Leaf374]
MASVVQRAQDALRGLRRRRPGVDHVLLMQEHYGAVKAGQQAGAVTYFGFLSVFPILALALFVVGYVSQVYPGANQDLREAIDQLLPGLIGQDEGQVSLADIRTFSGWAAVIGLAGVLYSGLAWLSALRDALLVVFETPTRELPNFVVGKLRDLVTLVVLGSVLLLSVAVAGLVSAFSTVILDALGLGEELSWLVRLLTVVFGLAANTVLFYAMFRLLAEPHVPARSLWQGALLGAVVFEALKQLSGVLLAATREQPAAQAFGIALILLVWINYFSRLVLYAAAFAFTTRAARAARVAEPADPVQGPPLASGGALDGTARAAGEAAGSRVRPFVAGAATGAAALAVVLRTTKGEDR